MATFQKRGSTWQYTISRYTNGKYDPIRKGGFRTKTEAKAVSDVIEGEMAQGISPVLKRDIFADYFEEWVLDLKSAKAGVTFTRYLNTLETIKKDLGQITLQDLTKRKYQRFLNEYGQTHAHSTIRKLNTHIRACVKDAVDEGRIRVDFTRDAEINSKVVSKESDERHLDYVESIDLLAELKKRLDKSLGYYLLLLALTTGMRFGELCGVKRSDFDFKKNVIRVRQAWDYKSGTGFAPLKNKQSKRDIAVDEITMSIFEEKFKTLPLNIHSAVFFNVRSSKGTLTNEATNKLLKNTLKHLSIDPITIHGLRHTYISVLLYKGGSLQFVSERAGHSDVETTLKYYSHVLKEMRQEEEAKSILVMSNMQKEAI